MIEEVQCITCKIDKGYRVMLIKVRTMEEFACFTSPREEWDNDDKYLDIIDHYCYKAGIYEHHVEFYDMDRDVDRVCEKVVREETKYYGKNYD